jgi:tetratricopeptide (TPR) repeat protein
MGFVQRGVTYLAEALSLWRELGETLVVSRTEAELGNALRNAGDHLAALGHLEHALASYRELGDEAGEIVTLTRLGTLHNVRFDQRAIDVLERAVVICRGGDFGQGELSWALTLLGPAYVRAGRLADAHRVLDEALVRFRSAGDRYGSGYTLRELGLLADSEHDYATGARYHQEAIDVFGELRAGTGSALALEGLAGNLEARSEPAAALAAYRRAASLFAELGDQAREGTVRLKAARVLRELGDGGEAEAERQRGEALLEGKDLPAADAIRRGQLSLDPPTECA